MEIVRLMVHASVYVWSNQKKIYYLFALLLLSGLNNMVMAEGSEKFTAFMVENDVFTGDDSGYTSGIGYVWGYAGFSDFDDSNTPAWIRGLSEGLYISTVANKKRSITYHIAQRIVTPENIDVKEFQPNDFPYSGLLTWKATQYAMDNDVTDTISLLLGVVGPLSGAEQSQKLVHSLTGSRDPQGWDNQLDNEPVFKLSVARNWRLLAGGITETTDYDVIGAADAGIGNYSSTVDLGITFRFGSQLLQTYPAISIIPGREINPLFGSASGSYYYFVSLAGRYTANNIVINGNTFRDNAHNITMEHGQSIYSAGVSIAFGDWSVLFGVTESSKAIKESQKHRSSYGSLSLTWKLD